MKIEKRLYIVATGKGMKDFMEEIGSPCELQEVVGRDFDIWDSGLPLYSKRREQMESVGMYRLHLEEHLALI